LYEQGDSGVKVNILGGGNNGSCEEKKNSFEHVSNSECLLKPNSLNKKKNLSAEINRENDLELI
jgi:hypothetical protein